MENKEINWKQIIVTILLTAIVTFATSIILDWYRSEEPKLIYSTTESLPFEGKDNYFGIYHIKIANEGKNPISDVIGYINVPNSLINDKKISIDPSINYTEHLQNDTYTLQAQYLNPQDSVEVSLLVLSKGQPPAVPVLSIRGRGVNGKLESPTSENTPITILMIPLITGMMAFVMVNRFNFLKNNLTKGKKSELFDHKQNEILAYLCRMNGLIDEGNKYLESTRNVTYWAEADNLGYMACLNTSSQEKKEKIKKLLWDLMAYADPLVDTSRAVIYYRGF